MQIKMNDSHIKSISEIEGFLNSKGEMSFEMIDKEEAYAWIQSVLAKHLYSSLTKPEKSVVKRYIKSLTGYSRSTVTRLIGQYTQTKRIRLKEHNRNRFRRLYTEADIRLLAETDELHNYPNGAGLRRILQRQIEKFGQLEYQNISKISVSHIYNVRKTPQYKRIAKSYCPTKPSVQVTIGTRKEPKPDNRPGFLRIDTVHQGDQDKEKGVYHINIIDEVTQWEFLASVEKISERYLYPIIEQLLSFYPYEILGFHSDNGKEYINYRIAKLLEKNLIEFTKSRARHSADNALVESKNGAIIRKFIGYEFIEQKWATAINRFYFNYYNQYLNYHRPCAFAQLKKHPTKKGKIIKVYPQNDYQTPYEKFRALPNAKTYLKKGITFENLDLLAYEHTDNEYAKIVQDEKKKLFKIIDSRLPII